MQRSLEMRQHVLGIAVQCSMQGDACFCTQVIQGVCIGVVLALCMVILIYIVHGNLEQARKILLSFIRTSTSGFRIGFSSGFTCLPLAGVEVRLALAILLEVVFFIRVACTPSWIKPFLALCCLYTHACLACRICTSVHQRIHARARETGMGPRK